MVVYPCLLSNCPQKFGKNWPIHTSLVSNPRHPPGVGRLQHPQLPLITATAIFLVPVCLQMEMRDRAGEGSGRLGMHTRIPGLNVLRGECSCAALSSALMEVATMEAFNQSKFGTVTEPTMASLPRRSPTSHATATVSKGWTASTEQLSGRAVVVTRSPDVAAA